MCTVSYIPLKNGYILTSNRDENPLRNTIKPQKQQLSNGETIMAPIDIRKRGTWIATNTRNKTACLLNGAYKKHQRLPNYKRSRGHYVIEAFTYPSFQDFVQQEDLHDIEPFTLIFIEDSALQTMVWDGNEKHYEQLNEKESYLWSSCTLYTEKEHQKKEVFFRDFLNRTIPDKNRILNIHGLEEKTPFILDKPQTKTVSIAQAISNHNTILLGYYPKN